MSSSFYTANATNFTPLSPIVDKQRGKVYADVPLNFFTNIEELKKYVTTLKALGVNVLLILPHFLPSFSPYVVKNFEQPCSLFGTWEKFAEFMLFVKNLGMDRMIDIPFNHADKQADNLKKEWYKDHASGGIEAGADDEDADKKRVRINWGAYILDNSNPELQTYWLEKVIFPHIEKMHVNAIRIDAAWGLDAGGLKRIIKETRQKFAHVWFLAENLGMAPLIKLAKSGIEAGADRFFNNMYWYSGGLYIPTDVYKLYKHSRGLPTCSIYSSHDTLMPAMKAYAKLRNADVKGMNDKAIVRKFVAQDKLTSLTQLSASEQQATIQLMKLDFALSALMTSDIMFVAGSENALFERVDVLHSSPTDFARGLKSDLPDFMKAILQIKASNQIFNSEGVLIPFGAWQADKQGIKGYLKTTKSGKHLLVATNTASSKQTCRLPKRMTGNNILHTASGTMTIHPSPRIELEPNQILILSSN